MAKPEMREFASGAMRNKDAGKLDYEAFFSPLAMEAVAKYMNFHSELEDGSLRATDNWQLGIPKNAYFKSLWRHLHAAWKITRGYGAKEGIVFSMAGVIFNAQGFLHEHLKKHPDAADLEVEGQTLARDTERAERARQEYLKMGARDAPWPAIIPIVENQGVPCGERRNGLKDRRHLQLNDDQNLRRVHPRGRRKHDRDFSSLPYYHRVV